MWLPGYSFVKCLPARCSFIFRNWKIRRCQIWLYGGFSISQWNCSRSKACVCRTICGSALLCNRTIPRESLPLRRFWIARRIRSSVHSMLSHCPYNDLTLRGAMGEISNFYNLSRRFFIFGTHIPAILTTHTSKFHSCQSDTFWRYDYLFLEIGAYFQNLSPRTNLKCMI